MEPVNLEASLMPWTPGIFSLAIYAGAVLLLASVLLFISSFLGEKKKANEKLKPYESGVVPTGTARLKYPVPFFLVAIFFLIFDVEGAYIFSWAGAARRLGWPGWFQISFFIIVLLAGLVYILQNGGLSWGPTKK